MDYYYYYFFCQAALDHLSQRTDIDTSRIVVFGRSLGGAVGSVLTKNNPDKVTRVGSHLIFIKKEAAELGQIAQIIDTSFSGTLLHWCIL